MKSKFTLSFILFLLSQINFAQSFNWAARIGGTQPNDQGTSIATDSSGNVYTMGTFRDTVDFDPGVDSFMLTALGFDDIFIQKLDSNGHFVWAKRMGNNYQNISNDILIDGDGNVLSCFQLLDTMDVDPGVGVYNLFCNGNPNIVLQKLDANGNFLWAKSWGGANSESAVRMKLDSHGNIILVGYFSGTAYLNPGDGSDSVTALGNYSDVFVEKLDPLGNFIWAKTMGSISSDYIRDFTIDKSDNIYSVGYFQGTIDMDPDAAVFNLTSAGNYDIFIQKLDAAGNFQWAKQIGGTAEDQSKGIGLDEFGALYTSGYFSNTVDFDPGPGIFNITSLNGKDAFIQKLDTAGNFIWTKRIGGQSTQQAFSLIIDGLGNVIIEGLFVGTADFDPGIGVYNMTSPGSGGSTFIEKINSAGDLVWAIKVKVSGGVLGMALDYQDNLYATGYFFNSADFNPGQGVFTLTSAGSNDGFVLKLGRGNCDNFTLVVDSTFDVRCSSQGLAYASALNGTPPYSFDWSTIPAINTSSAVFSTPDIYSLVVTDSIGCFRTSSIIINAPDTLTGMDLSADLVYPIFVVGLPSVLTIDALNRGCLPATGSLKLVLDTSVTYHGAVPPPDAISGDTLIWNFSNWIYDSLHFQPEVYVTTDSNAHPNQPLTLKLSITPLAGDIDTTNNNRTYLTKIRGAFDPNDIQVYPKGACNAGLVLPAQKLTYTIRFQNTGNSDAINIYLLDTLNPNLDLNTVRIIGKSHEGLVTEVLSGNVLKFRFDNIHLADSFSNEAASHGYLIFEVDPVAGIADGTTVENKAGIYFDFNEPVFTNTVSNTFVNALPVYNTTISPTACQSYTLNTQTYTASGVYAQTLSSADGCDSTVTLNLTILSKDSSSLNGNICEGSSYPFFGQQLDSSGTYRHVLQNINGCDSVIELSLAVLNVQNTTIDTVIAQGTNYTLPSGLVVTTTGTYRDTLIASNTCDSIVTTHLDVVSGISSIRNPNSEIRIYPNPATESVTISVDASLIGSALTITDVTGREVMAVRVLNSAFSIPTSAFASGVYFVTVANEKGRVTKKLVKQ